MLILSWCLNAIADESDAGWVQHVIDPERVTSEGRRAELVRLARTVLGLSERDDRLPN